MGPSIRDCDDTLSGIGDNTGGPIWRMGLEPDQPLLGGSQKMTNFPDGENLYSPVGYAAIAQSVIMRGATEVVGPVCAYNVFNMLGYMTTAIVMFGFILFLVKSRWIALMSGYAVAFTPYVQSKIGGHPSYGFASLLIALLWLAVLIMKNKKYIHGVALGAILALCAYFDPYFVLLSATILLPVTFAWVLSFLVLSKDNKKKYFSDYTKALKVFIVAFIVFVALLAPLVFVRVKNSAVITSTTSATRGDVEQAASKCSNLPQDYLLPDPYNYPLIKIFGNGYTQQNINLRHWCGTGESRVSISLAIILIVLLGLVVLLWEKLNRRRVMLDSFLPIKPSLILGALVATALLAFLIGLPPRIEGIIMPSGLIIKITEMWRIFAREYLVLNVALVAVMAVVLAYFQRVFYARSKRVCIGLFILIFLLIISAYQINPPFTPFTFSYRRDAPKVYRYIKDNPDITSLAEYPLDRTGIESDAAVYYTTMQVVHMKPILNSAAPSNKNEALHIAIKDLSDPQTLPILRHLGIEYITIHGLSSSEVLSETNQLEIILEETPSVYGLTMIRSAPSNTIVLARIKDGPSIDRSIVFKDGFVVNLEIMKDPVNMQYETLNNATLSVKSLDKNEKNTPELVCFDAKMAYDKDVSEMSTIVNGRSVRVDQLSGAKSRISFLAKPGDSIRLSNSNGYNVRIDNLGCTQEEIL